MNENCIFGVFNFFFNFHTQKIACLQLQKKTTATTHTKSVEGNLHIGAGVRSNDADQGGGDRPVEKGSKCTSPAITCQVAGGCLIELGYHDNQRASYRSNLCVQVTLQQRVQRVDRSTLSLPVFTPTNVQGSPKNKTEKKSENNLKLGALAGTSLFLNHVG